MRRGCIAMLCLLCLLTACGRKEPEITAWTPEQMVRAILDSQKTEEQIDLITQKKDIFDTYVADYYSVDPADAAEGAVAYAGGVSALEVAVLHLVDSADAETAVQALTAYIDARAGAFAGYAPEQYAILEGSKAVGRGQYAALLICPDVEAAEEAFAACFTSEAPKTIPMDMSAVPIEEIRPDPAEPAVPEPDPAPEPEPDSEQLELEPDVEEPEPPEPDQPEDPAAPEPEPEAPWIYDEQRILDAWTSGQREGLAEKDLAILEALEDIPALTDETLTDYERELALHDWMIAWAEYDPGALSNNPRGEPMPDNDNPYGFLTGKKGICLGYAYTFQLLMDLSGIECLTVHGTAHAGTSDHAWNLVKLDGEWYAVDVTWDDPVSSFPVSESTAHIYFNVTDEVLRQCDHQWDAESVPEANGSVWIWYLNR